MTKAIPQGVCGAFGAMEPLRLHCNFNVSLNVARTFADLGEG